MKIQRLVLLPLCGALLVGCQLFDKVKYQEDDYGKGVDSATATLRLTNAVALFNPRNFLCDYWQKQAGIPIVMQYKINGYLALVDGEIYDYSDADATGKAKVYVPENGKYYIDYDDVSKEPGYSRFITRGTIEATWFTYSEKDNEYTMNETGRNKYSLDTCKLKIKVEDDKITKIHFNFSTKKVECYADFTEFGKQNVKAPDPSQIID